MILESPHQLTTFNEHEGAARTHWAKAAKLKKENTELVALYAKRLAPITRPADYTFTWYWPNQRADSDNIAFAVKYILDGLQLANKLPNDSLKWVRSITHFYEIGSPKVVIEIEEA